MVTNLSAMSEPTSETTTTQELSAEQAAAKVSSDEAQLVDVRRDHEFEAGHIAGAIHIPLDSLPARAGELDQERPIIFQCKTGSRSAMATDAFRESGIEAYNLAGGIEAWVEAGKPIEPADGRIADSARKDNS